MENDNTINPSRPKTYSEVMQEANWEGVEFFSKNSSNQNEEQPSLNVSQSSDRYLAGAIPSPQLTQDLPEGISLADIAKLAELFRS